METVKVYKDDGRYTFSDFTLQKIGTRLKELNKGGSYWAVMRHYSKPVDFYFISVAWYAAKVEAYDVASVTLPEATFHKIPEEFVAQNITSISDIMSGRIQTPNAAPKVYKFGPKDGSYSSFEVINTSKYLEDNRILPAPADGTVHGDKTLGYLMSPSHFLELLAGP